MSGILDSTAKRSSGEVVAENWNSVPIGRGSLRMSVQRLVSACVTHSRSHGLMPP